MNSYIIVFNYNDQLHSLTKTQLQLLCSKTNNYTVVVINYKYIYIFLKLIIYIFLKLIIFTVFMSVCKFQVQ